MVVVVVVVVVGCCSSCSVIRVVQLDAISVA